MASYKPFFTEEKSKSMIKGAIGGEFKSDFNDDKKTPFIKELDVKKTKKSESYESAFPEESEVLDNPDEIKDQERKKLLGSVHPSVMNPDEVKVDHVEISYGYTHDDFPSEGEDEIPGHDATDSRFDGRMNEELVDDSHSMVKRAINADFTMGDVNKDKGDPKAPEFGAKKKTKKNESSQFYRSIFSEVSEGNGEHISRIVYSFIEELDDMDYEYLSKEGKEKISSDLKRLEDKINQVKQRILIF
jgi:hypothetical protein